MARTDGFYFILVSVINEITLISSLLYTILLSNIVYKLYSFPKSKSGNPLIWDKALLCEARLRDDIINPYVRMTRKDF